MLQFIVRRGNWQVQVASGLCLELASRAAYFDHHEVGRSMDIEAEIRKAIQIGQRNKDVIELVHNCCARIEIGNGGGIRRAMRLDWLRMIFSSGLSCPLVVRRSPFASAWSSSAEIWRNPASCRGSLVPDCGSINAIASLESA
jgi:hypothetical protein